MSRDCWTLEYQAVRLVQKRRILTFDPFVWPPRVTACLHLLFRLQIYVLHFSQHHYSTFQSIDPLSHEIPNRGFVSRDSRNVESPPIRTRPRLQNPPPARYDETLDSKPIRGRFLPPQFTPNRCGRADKMYKAAWPSAPPISKETYSTIQFRFLICISMLIN